MSRRLLPNGFGWLARTVFILRSYPMLARYFLFAALFVSAAARAQLPPPSPIPKDGDCPSGYAAEGASCAPGKAAKFVIAKSGDCPEAYEAEGNYCVATVAAKLAIRRAAMSCPSGFESTGNYCVSVK